MVEVVAAREMIENAYGPGSHHDKARAKHWPTPRPPAPSDDGAGARSIDELRQAAESCRRCPLWRDATQTVFGEGPEKAKVVFVGEQPGDQEDLAGKPFVGPAGKVFDAVLEDAGIDRHEDLRHQRGKTFQVRAARQTPHPLQAQRRRNPGLPLVARQ